MLLTILGLGLYLRMQALGVRYQEMPSGTSASVEYQRYAEQLLDYSLKGERFPPTTPNQKPVFAIVLAVVFRLFGRGALVQYWTTTLISTATVATFSRLIWRLFGPLAGMLAAFALAVNGALVHNAPEGLSNPLLNLLLVAIMSLTLQQAEEWRRGRAWLLGLATALVSQTREEGWVIVAGFYLVIAWQSRGNPLRGLKRNLPVLMAPVAAWAVMYLWQSVNGLSAVDLEHRYGTAFFAIEFISGKMPQWYYRTFIHEGFFHFTYIDWLLRFHTPVELLGMILNGAWMVLLGLQEVSSTPVMAVALIGLYLMFRGSTDTDGAGMCLLAVVWIAAITAVLAPWVAFIDASSRGVPQAAHRYIGTAAIMLLMPVGLVLAQERPLLSARATKVPPWLYATIVALVVAHYGYCQLFRHREASQALQSPVRINLAREFDTLIKGDDVSASQQFSEAIERHPEYAPAHFGRALAAMRQRDVDLAKEEFSRALDIFPWYAEAYLGYGGLLLQLGELAAAEQVLWRCLEFRPDYPPVHLLLASAYTRSGDAERGVEHYRKYLEKVKQLRIRMIEKCDAMVASAPRGNRPDVQRIRERLASVLGTPAEALLDGQLYRILYHHLDDEGLYAVGGEGTAFLRLRDGRVDHLLGNALMVLGRTAEAIEQYAKALELDPEDAETLNNLGVAFAMRGEFAQAENRLQAALDQGQELWVVHNNLGRLYADRGDDASAAVQWEWSAAAGGPAEVGPRSYKLVTPDLRPLFRGL